VSAEILALFGLLERLSYSFTTNTMAHDVLNPSYCEHTNEHIKDHTALGILILSIGPVNELRGWKD